MAKARVLKDEEKGGIITLLDSGLKIAEIARRMELPDSTVRSFVKRYQERRSIKNKRNSGRPPKASPRAKRLLAREAMKNRRHSCHQLTVDCALDVSTKSISNYLREAAFAVTLPPRSLLSQLKIKKKTPVV